MPETSIIIRTKNEARWVGECLARLAAQTYRNFEIIVLDSGSTDQTLEIVKRYDVKLYAIESSAFTYPYALNKACRRANAEKYFVILSAHSLPSSSRWLEEGLSNFTDQRAMGVYGFVWALPDASIWEKLIFNEYASRLQHLFRRRTIMRKPGMGVMGFTNAIIRKNLWERQHFDEAYALGGEDGAWTAHWMERSYVAICDMSFSVYHSHGLGLKALIRQWQYWRSLKNPQPFVFPEYRKNIK